MHKKSPRDYRIQKWICIVGGFPLVKSASADVRPGYYSHRSRVHTIPGVALLINWTLRLHRVFQFICNEVYNIVENTFPLPLWLKEGYVRFRGRSWLLHETNGSRCRPILDRSGGSPAAGRLMLLFVYACF